MLKVRPNPPHARCTECGTSLARASERRLARGLPRLGTRARTCSPGCSQKYAKRWAREWWAARKNRKIAPRPTGTPWRCSECGIGLEKANRKRRGVGLPPIGAKNVVCSLRCAKARDLRRYIIRYGRPPRRRHAAIPEVWRCAICACTPDEANAKRKKLGIRALPSHSAACSPACVGVLGDQKSNERLRSLRAFNPADPFRGRRGEWVCSECGVDSDGALVKRRRLGLGPPVRVLPTCSPVCQDARRIRRQRARLAHAPRSPRGAKRNW